MGSQMPSAQLSTGLINQCIGEDRNGTCTFASSGIAAMNRAKRAWVLKLPAGSTSDTDVSNLSPFQHYVAGRSPHCG